MKKKVEIKKKIEKLSDESLVKLLKISALIQCLLYAGVPVKVYANALQTSTFYTGMMKLLSDGTTVLLAAEAVIVVVLEIAAGIKYQTAEIDEKKIHKKEAKSILIVGVLIISATTLLKVVFSYFQ